MMGKHKTLAHVHTEGDLNSHDSSMFVHMHKPHTHHLSLARALYVIAAQSMPCIKPYEACNDTKL